MLEPALSISTLSNEEEFSLRDCWLRDTKELNWWQHLGSSVGGIMTLSIPTMWLFPDLCLIFCHSQVINRLSKPLTLLLTYFPKSPFRLIGMVGEASYQVLLIFHGLPITPNLFWVHFCLNIPNFVIVYIDFMIFRTTILVCWPQTNLYSYEYILQSSKYRNSS